MKKLISLYLSLFLLLLASPVGAATWYVRPITGEYGAEDGTTYATAFDGFAGITWGVGGVVAGDTLYYSGTLYEILAAQASGTLGAPIVIRGDYPGDPGVIDGSVDVLGVAGDWTEGDDGVWSKNVGATVPEVVWFNSNVWGVVDATPDTVYEWTYSNPNLSVYTAPGDYNPATYYTSIRKGTLTTGINISNRDYITVKDGTIQYVDNNCIKQEYNQTGTVVDGNTVRYCGKKTATDGGNGILLQSATSTVQNNTIHNCGTHAIYLVADAGVTISSSTIQNNTCYDSYHSLIDIQSLSTGSTSNITIQRNNLYYTADYDDPTVVSSNAIFVKSAGSNNITGVKIYYNTIHDLVYGAGIYLDAKVSGAEVYNNTIYGSVAGLTGWSAGIVIPVEALATGVATIKNNISMDVNWLQLSVDTYGQATVDNNLWYQSGGGTKIYTSVGGTSYHYDDQAAYKAATGWDTNGKWEDPLFVSATNFHLQSGSPCKDVGDDTVWSGTASITDFKGTNITNGAGTIVAPGDTCDIGAMEYQAATAVLTDVGADELLKTYFNNSRPGGGNNLTLRLYVADRQLADTDTTCPTAAIGGGYADKTLTNGSWTITTANDPSDSVYAQQTWTFTGPLTAGGGTIYGYCILDADSTVVVEEKFSTYFTPTANGDYLRLTPKVKMSKGVPD